VREGDKLTVRRWEVSRSAKDEGRKGELTGRIQRERKRSTSLPDSTAQEGSATVCEGMPASTHRTASLWPWRGVYPMGDEAASLMLQFLFNNVRCVCV